MSIDTNSKPGLANPVRTIATRISERKNIAVFMLLFYGMTRLYFHEAGIRFDASTLPNFWQYLDINWLANDLLLSLYYQHSQPPLFNFLLGVVIKLFPNSSDLVFSLLFHGFTLLIYFLMYNILRKLHFGRLISMSLSSFFIVMPNTILYENWLFQTWPAATLLMVSAYAILMFCRKPKYQYVILFFSSLVCLCLLRSMFHLVFLLPAFLAPFLIVRRFDKKIFTFAVIAFSIVALLYIKNSAVFGFSGGSSWLGMNLARMINTGNTPDHIADPAIVNKQPFLAAQRYPASYLEIPEKFSGIKPLTKYYKSSGKINFNHYSYIAISQEYKKAALYTMKTNPGLYMNNIGLAWDFYGKPASDYPFLYQNRSKLKFFSNPENYHFPWFVYSALILLLAFWLSQCWKTLRSGPDRDFYFLCFICFVVFYVAFIGNSFELGENNRFRVQTDALVYIGLLMALTKLLPGSFFSKSCVE